MDWIAAHRLWFGIAVDVLSFAGASILARDAFLRLRELKTHRINQEFRAKFPDLNLSDKEWLRAVSSLRWTLVGFTLLMAGFVGQILLRLAEGK
ncbi:MAG TPA: hypothetical protein VGB94_06125 [Acidobacteriaceae bacterium]